MRVFLTRPLLGVVQGTDDWLRIRGRMKGAISPEVEQALEGLSQEIAEKFNSLFTREGEGVDYVSEPRIIMPDQFFIELDVEGLGRLAREVLVDMVPRYVDTWQTKAIRVAELWLGGGDELLTREEQEALKRTRRDIWRLPVKGQTFVFGSTVPEMTRIAGAAAVREAGGIVLEGLGGECDYFITDQLDEGERAKQMGAKHVIDTLTARVMVGVRE
ncbi:MAG: hypothetical protein QN141_10780 [Armatimonadota bacterium]|nr:hypothetical protein [Armatimonadota bacterium]MDR7451468.1 hypothetical protein [Armatimonadota bacterium]MDR7467435.1 hypothetical protein [Armatimonadota bacterium]MDR7494309.1 hypothetical protein [Armatimonadota bacterium]MDR7504853.1 hypothetical protein [Armatimonadota bacterium]